MSAGLTPKQEKFAQAYVETGNASEAYRRAFDAKNSKTETINKRASELLASGAVTGRVEELRKATLKRHEITVDTIRDMLLEDRAFARELETPAAAVSATEKLGKLSGLFTEKVEHSLGAGLADKLIAARNRSA